VIRSHRGKTPQIAPSAYVDPQAVIIGDVVIGEHSSIWPGAVVRGDCHWIRIGARTSIQDLCVLHVESGQYGLTVGDNVTVGHRVILHGCTVASNCLIGMGSIILNDAKIGEHCIIGAGALILEHQEIPPGSVVLGSPGKVRRAITDADRQHIARSAEHYVGFGAEHKAEKSG